MLVDFQLVSHKLLNNEVFVCDSHGDHGLHFMLCFSADWDWPLEAW